MIQTSLLRFMGARFLRTFHRICFPPSAVGLKLRSCPGQQVRSSAGSMPVWPCSTPKSASFASRSQPPRARAMLAATAGHRCASFARRSATAAACPSPATSPPPLFGRTATKTGSGLRLDSAEKLIWQKIYTKKDHLRFIPRHSKPRVSQKQKIAWIRHFVFLRNTPASATGAMLFPAGHENQPR